MLVSTEVNELVNGFAAIGVTDIEKVATFFIEAGFNLSDVIYALEIGVGGEWELELTHRLKEILEELNR